MNTKLLNMLAEIQPAYKNVGIKYSNSTRVAGTVPTTIKDGSKRLIKK